MTPQDLDFLDEQAREATRAGKALTTITPEILRQLVAAARDRRAAQDAVAGGVHRCDVVGCDAPVLYLTTIRGARHQRCAAHRTH